MKVAEFRKSIKECLDAAARGQTIVIERGGIIFQLKAGQLIVTSPQQIEDTLELPKPKKIRPLVAKAKLSKTVVPKVIEKPADVAKVVTPDSSSRTCPNGHLTDWRGKCFDKKCKYAK